MRSVRGFRRRRWPVLIACIAVAVPLIVSGSGLATAGGQTARLAAPSVEGDYLYAQLYAMAKAYSYRISGADGATPCPDWP